MMNPIEIIDKYYGTEGDLRAVLLSHSGAVRRKALETAQRYKLEVDCDFVSEAAMLHDIGIIRCNAPGIFCFGELPYICHGIAGRQMLEGEGLPRHALVCERHTGSGLTAVEIEAQGLPLPRRDMVPLTLEEKLVCYADKFFSKGGGSNMEKSPGQVRKEMARHGDGALERWVNLEREIERITQS